MSPKDQIYVEPLARIADFAFDEKVAAVFPDMIKRSVPGYATIIAQIGVLAGRYAQPDSRCYDLGCSLGAATLSMRHRINQSNSHIIAVDNSAQMLLRCRQNLSYDSSAVPVQLICADIQDVKIMAASVVVLNFTLQFIEPKNRLGLLARIYQGMLPGGALLLSEKVVFAEKGREKLMSDWHLDFKRANGYSDLEISQKRTALEKVMIPDSISKHQGRLYHAGFQRSEVWFQCYNFISILAMK